MSIPLSNVILGSELWIKTWMEDDEVEALVSGMVNTGLKVARVFIFWTEVEPHRDEWDFAGYDRLFRYSEKHGLQITLTLCALYPPAWMQAEIVNMNLVDPDNPMVIAKSGEYTHKVVERYKDSPALHSWILQNEPGNGRFDKPNEYSIKSFRAYLRDAYSNDLNLLNKYHNEAYRSFDDVGAIYADGSGELPCLADRNWIYAGKMDWYRFCCFRLDKQLKAVQDVIKEFDSVHPTSVNPCNVVWQSAGCGQDVFSEGELVDFMGSTAHVAWASRQLRERNNQYVALLNEITKSASTHPDGFYYITELQAGTIIFAGSRPFTPTADELTHWLWESISSGAKGVIYWLYNARESGFEGMEWGLTNQQFGESDRTIASRAVSDLVYSNQDFFDTLIASKRNVFVLFSHNTQFLGNIEGGWVDSGNTSPLNPRNRSLGGDGIAGAFNMLSDLGWSPGIVYEKKVKKMITPGGILIAPSTYSLDKETVEEIEDFVKEGGTLICDSFFACKNGWGRTEPANFEAQRRMFGGGVMDIVSRYMDEPMPVKTDNGEFDGWYLSVQLENGAYEGSKVLARFADGRPAAIERKYGGGRVVYIATIFFQRYFNDPLQGHLDFISSVLPPMPSKPLALLNPGTHMRMKTLDSAYGGDGLMVLLNHKQSGYAHILFTGELVVTDIVTGEAISGAAGQTARIMMGDMQVKVFRVQYKNN